MLKVIVPVFPSATVMEEDEKERLSIEAAIHGFVRTTSKVKVDGVILSVD